MICCLKGRKSILATQWSDAQENLKYLSMVFVECCKLNCNFIIINDCLHWSLYQLGIIKIWAHNYEYGLVAINFLCSVF